MNVFIHVGRRHQKWLKTVQQHSRFWTEYFGETLLRRQRMVAELRLTDPLPDLAVDDVLELKLGVSRSELYTFESSPSPGPIEDGAGLFSYENSLYYFARYQFIFYAKDLDVFRILLVASLLIMFSYCREIVGNFAVCLIRSSTVLIVC